MAIQETQSLSALARVKLLEGETEEALDLSSQVIERLGDSQPPDANELHFTHFRVLEVNGRSAEALPHLELAYQAVAEQAEEIRDEDLRRGFLDACHEILTAREGHAPSESV